MRLIDADSLCNSFELSDFNGDSNDNLNNACYIVSSMPTVEAIPMSIIEDIKAEIKEWYWQADKQAIAKDPCVVDAMIDLFIRTIDKHISGKENK